MYINTTGKGRWYLKKKKNLSDLIYEYGMPFILILYN